MRFHLAEALTGRLGPSVDPSAWEFTDPLTGKGEGSLTLPIPYDVGERESLRRMFAAPCQLVVEDDVGRLLPWSGPCGPPRDSGDGTLSLQWQDWRSWLHVVLLRSGNYLKAEVDQATAMRDLAAMYDDPIDGDDARTGPAVPMIAVDTLDPTGVEGQVVVRRWQSIGEELDTIAGRDEGIEWWTTVERLADRRYVRPRVRFAWPERHTRVKPLVLGWGGDTIENITSWDPPEPPASMPRVVGLAGSPPDQLWAMDDDPDLEDGLMLLRETASSHDVTSRATLYDYAAAERDRTGLIETLTVSTTGDNPQVGDYGPGDRFAVVIDGDWTQVDVPAARLIEARYSGAGGMCLAATLALDLTDAELMASEEA